MGLSSHCQVVYSFWNKSCPELEPHGLGPQLLALESLALPSTFNAVFCCWCLSLGGKELAQMDRLLKATVQTFLTRHAGCDGRDSMPR